MELKLNNLNKLFYRIFNNGQTAQKWLKDRQGRTL